MAATDASTTPSPTTTTASDTPYVPQSPPDSGAARRFWWFNPRGLFMLVAVPGACGGFVCWALGHSLHATALGWGGDLLVSLLLGAAAGFIIVVVLTNTNRDDLPRMFTLAFMAGIAYAPVTSQGLQSIGVADGDASALLDQALLEKNAALAQNEVLLNLSGYSWDLAGLLEKIVPAGSVDAARNPETEAAIAGQVAAFAEAIAGFPEEARSEMSARLFTNIKDTMPSPLAMAALRTAFSGANLVTGETAEEAIVPTLTHSDVVQPGPNAIVLDGEPATEFWVALEATAFAEYVIRVESSDGADLVAELFAPGEAGILESWAYDDDSAGLRNPQITFPLFPQTWYLKITEFYGAEVDSPRLIFKERDPGVQEAPIEVSGSLTQSYEPIANYLRDIPFTVATEGTYTIALTAEEPSLDSGAQINDLYAVLFDETYMTLAADDDAAGLDPRITISLSPGIQYLLEVFDVDQATNLNAMTLTITPAEPVSIPAQ